MNRESCRVWPKWLLGVWLLQGLSVQVLAQSAGDLAGWDAYYRGEPSTTLASSDSVAAFAALELIAAGKYLKAVQKTAGWAPMSGDCLTPHRYGLRLLVLAKLSYLQVDPQLEALLERARGQLRLICPDDDADLLLIMTDQFSRLAIQAGLDVNFEWSGDDQMAQVPEGPLARHLFPVAVEVAVEAAVEAAVETAIEAAVEPALSQNAPYIRLQVWQGIAAVESLYGQSAFSAAAQMISEIRLLLANVALQPRYLLHELDSMDAVVQRRLGHLQRAYELNQKIYRDVTSLFAPTHEYQALSANNFGVLQLERGRYDDALALFQNALDLAVSMHGESSSDAISTRRNMSAVLLEVGDVEEALALARDSYTALADQSDATRGSPQEAGLVSYALGLACREAGNFECAHSALTRARELYVEAHGVTHERIAFVDHARALTYRAQGKRSLAEQHLRHALKIYARIYPELKSRNAFLASLELAEVTSNALEQEQLWQNIALHAREIPSTEAQWRGYAGWAEQESRAGYRASAVFFGKLAVNSVQRLSRGVALSPRLQTFYFIERRHSYDLLLGLLVDAGRLVEAQDVKRLMEADERYEYQGRQRRNTTLASATFTAVEQQMLVRVEDLSEPMQLFEMRRLLELAGLNGSRKSVAARAKPASGSAVLNYFVLADRVEVILSTAAAIDHHRRVFISRTQLRRKVSQLHDLLRAGDAGWRALSEELYAVLVRPVEALLVADGLLDDGLGHLFISADDVLRYVPFAVLSDGDSLLIDRLAVARLAPEPASDSVAPTSEIAAFATTRAHPPLPALPAAQLEVRAIVDTGFFDSGMFNGTEHFDEEFTLERFRKKSAGARLVHIASHFQVAGGNDKDSFLLFGDGRRLSLRDLRREQWDLSAADLAVLSGCSTAFGGGLGSGVELEGFAGLIHSKGAKQVLATLWPVDDAATALVIQDFYRELAGGLGAVDALAAAQRVVSSSHPVDWAAFVLWSPLSGTVLSD